MEQNRVEVLWAARYYFRQGWKFSPHQHDYYQMFYFAEGTGEFRLNGAEPFQIKPCQLVLVKPFEKHSLIENNSSAMKIYDLKFLIHDDFIRELLFELDYINLSQANEIDSLINKICEEGLQKKPFFTRMCDLYLEQILLLLTRTNRDEADRYNIFTIKNPNLICQKVTGYLEDHYQENLTLESIADAVGYNQSYLCQIFNKSFQCSPMKYLQILRLTKAKELITNPELTLEQVAQLTGFNSIHHFTQVFHKSEGMTPSQWRNGRAAKKGIFIRQDFTNKKYINGPK